MNIYFKLFASHSNERLPVMKSLVQDEDTMEDAEEVACEEGRPCSAAQELRGVQDCGGTQAGERMDTKFGAKFRVGETFSD